MPNLFSKGKGRQICGPGHAGDVRRSLGEDLEMPDYIIIGAGSGGAVLTNRLSADPNVEVAVIEAGDWDKSPWIHMPMGYFRLMQTLQLDWGYYTVPQKHVNNRVMFVPRAKSIGGCTTVKIPHRPQVHGGFYSWRVRARCD